MSAPFARLEGIARALAAGEAVMLSEGEWLATCLKRFRDGAPQGLRLDDVFGISAAQGKRPWWHREAQRRRDDALQALASLPRFASLPLTARAAAIATAVKRYEAAGWNIDRRRGAHDTDDMPAERHCLFSALKAGLPIPGRRRLLDILRRAEFTQPEPLLVACDPRHLRREGTHQPNQEATEP